MRCGRILTLQKNLAGSRGVTACDYNENNYCCNLCRDFSAFVYTIAFPLHNESFEVVVQSLSYVQLFATPRTTAYHQASLPFTISQILVKLMSVELVMPSNHPILSCPLLLLPSISPSIGVFFNESALHIRKQKYWSFSFRISPSDEYSG